MTTRGKFITIEGIEGAGKSTVLDFIQDYFSSKAVKARHLKFITTREPGGTPLAEDMRNLVLLHPGANEILLPETELLLMFAGRAQHISHVIMPALLSNQWVICDRYIDATYAYQGGGRQIDMSFIKLLDRQIVGQLYPDLTILLDVPVEVGMKRAESRQGKKDRIENETLNFFNNVRDVYLQRASNEPKRIKVVDANCAIEAVYAKVQRILDDLLKLEFPHDSSVAQ